MRRSKDQIAPLICAGAKPRTVEEEEKKGKGRISNGKIDSMQQTVSVRARVCVYGVCLWCVYVRERSVYECLWRVVMVLYSTGVG